MPTTEKSSVIVELYDLAITERKDDRFGRVVITRSLTEDDLVQEAVSRRTDLNAVTLKASIDILKEIAMEEVTNGASVRFGLGYFNLKANGVFIGDNARRDSAQHSLDIHVTPTGEFRSAVKAISVDVRGMAVSAQSSTWLPTWPRARKTPGLPPAEACMLPAAVLRSMEMTRA